MRQKRGVLDRGGGREVSREMANNAEEKRQKVTWPSGTKKDSVEKMCLLEIFLQVSTKYGDMQKNYEGTVFHLYF